MKRWVRLVVVLAPLLAFPVAGCEVSSGQRQASSKPPLKPSVPAFRNQTLRVRVANSSTVKIEGDMVLALQTYVVDVLNTLGKADGNRFQLAVGDSDFTLDYRVYGTVGRYSGGVQFSGWGWGDISYCSPEGSNLGARELVDASTRIAYNLIHSGWHDVLYRGGDGWYHVGQPGPR